MTGAKDTAATQQSFTTPVERAREVIARCSRHHDPDHVTLAVSGGTDSVVAADLVARMGPEFGIRPDSVTHINTGAAVPQSRLVARIVAEMHGLDFHEEGYRKQSGSLAHRVLDNGWPGAYGRSPQTGGHGLEWANRKSKPMDAAYMNLSEGDELWVSGARRLESKKRSGNVPDSGVDRDKPRRVWLSPISGWTSAEKRDYIRERSLPVSEAYLALGFSGECVACAFDDSHLLTDLDLIAPETSHAIRSLALWLYQRVRRGDVELAPKRLSWGWEPGDDETFAEGQETIDGEASTAQTMIGCDEESCSTRERPSWILDLPSQQIVDRDDVEQCWAEGIEPVARRFVHGWINAESEVGVLAD